MHVLKEKQMGNLLNSITKIEVYQLIAVLIGLIIWTFGANWNLPANEIAFAVNVVSFVVGHALGLNNNQVAPDTGITAAAPGEAKAP
jgi:hypothetical protein